MKRIIRTDTSYDLAIAAHDDGRIGVLTTNHAASSYGLPVLVIEGVAYGPSDSITLGGEPTRLRDCLLTIRAKDRTHAPADMDAFAAVLYEAEVNADRDAAADHALAAWLGRE